MYKSHNFCGEKNSHLVRPSSGPAMTRTKKTNVKMISILRTKKKQEKKQKEQRQKKI